MDGVDEWLSKRIEKKTRKAPNQGPSSFIEPFKEITVPKEPATPTGVEKPKVTVVKALTPENFHNPRNDLIANIGKQAEERGEYKDVGDLTDDENLTPETEPEEPKVEEAPEPEPDEPVVEEKTEQPEKQKEEDLETIKVDGEEQKVPRSKVYEAGLRALQKESAADKRLEEATRLLNEAKSIRQPPVEADADKQPPNDDVAALARAIRVGTDEEAEEAMRQLKSVATPPAPDVMNRMMDDRIEFRTAAEWFRTEYKDIFSDPDLTSWAANEDERQMLSGDKRPYKERYKSIGDAIRVKVKTWSSKFSEPPVTTTKQEKKASVTPIPAASVKAETPADDDNEEESPSQVISEIAKRRGQTYVR